MSRPPLPNLAAIDHAILRIQRGDNLFSCVALKYGTAANDHREHAQLYIDQFKQFVVTSNCGSLPDWWNWPGAGKKPRLEALRAFRQACIDAAQKDVR